MITDANLLCMNDQAVAATDTTVTADKSVALTTVRDIGPGTPIEPYCEVTTAITGGTSVAVSIITSATEDLGTPTTLYTTPAVAVASLVKGYTFKLPPLPAGITQGFIGFLLTNVGAVAAGKVRAGFVLSKPANAGATL